MEYNTSNNAAPARDRAKARISRQRGATVIELVLYLAGAVILLVAVFGLFGSGTLAARTRTESSNMQGLIAAVNRFYGTNRDFPTGNFTQSLVAADAVPASMKNASNQAVMRNQFGGNVTVTSGDGVSFNIVSDNLPKSACIELAQLPVNPVAINVNGSVLAVPVTAAATTGACTASVNTISWQFR